MRNAHLLLAALIFASSPSAFAQPTATDKATADALFRAGKELLDAGHASEACPKLAESQRIDPRAGTLLNLAVCHEQEGKTASAWAEFNEAASQAAAAKQPDREKFARARIDELEASLSRVKIVLQLRSQDIEVKLDGRVLRPAAIGTPIPVDPGPHVVEASSRGHKTWTRSLAMPRGPVVQEVGVPALEIEEAPAADASAAVNVHPKDPWPAVGLALFGLGSIALGSGVFFGLQTIAKKDDAAPFCVADRCTQPGLEAYEDASTAATWSTIMIGLSVALLASGAYLVLRPQTNPSKAAVLSRGGAVLRW